MYLVTVKLNNRDAPFTVGDSYAELKDAKSDAETRVTNPTVVEAQIWQIALTATTEAKTVFRAPNGKVEV